MSRITPLLLFAHLALAAVNPSLIKEKATALDRLKALSDEDFVFDFLNPPGGESNGAGGHTVAANADTFPALIGNSVGLTLGFLEGCGLNTPHIHPRATEFNLNVNGTNFATGVFQENGARLITQNLKPGQATIFQQGAIHFEQNLGCEPMLFVAAFGSEDFGVLQIAQGFLSQLPTDAIKATLGDPGYEYLPNLISKMPKNIAQGTEECLKRCGIERVLISEAVTNPETIGVPSTFQTDQAGNLVVLPDLEVDENTAFDGPPQFATADFDAVNRPAQSAVLPLTIALAAINGLLVLGLLAMAYILFIRRKESNQFSAVPLVSGAGEKYRDPYDTPVFTPNLHTPQ